MKQLTQILNSGFLWLTTAILWIPTSIVVAYFAGWHLDIVIGIALVTLLVMLLQAEHERCDRVRASWREVRRLTFAVTSAIQRARQKQDQPDAATYVERAQDLANELYSAVLLLYGKGSLREEYRKRFGEAMKTLVLARLLDVFAIVEIKAERKLDAWRLRIL